MDPAKDTWIQLKQWLGDWRINDNMKSIDRDHLASDAGRKDEFKFPMVAMAEVDFLTIEGEGVTLIGRRSLKYLFENQRLEQGILTIDAECFEAMDEDRCYPVTLRFIKFDGHPFIEVWENGDHVRSFCLQRA